MEIEFLGLSESSTEQVKVTTAANGPQSLVYIQSLVVKINRRAARAKKSNMQNLLNAVVV